MWRELLRFFAFLGRVGAFVFSVITLALIALTLVQRDWMDGISIYIVVMSVVSMLAAFVPPYPNFIFDSFFAVAWIICATFSFLIMVSEVLHDRIVLLTVVTVPQVHLLWRGRRAPRRGGGSLLSEISGTGRFLVLDLWSLGWVCWYCK